MRLIYTVLFYLALPFVLFRLFYRSIKNPDYRYRILERLGFYGKNIGFSPVDIWFHAVSVGEAEALFPLIKKFIAKYPNAKVLVTTTTPTGSSRVKKVLAESVQHVYFPYDLPDVIGRFLSRFKPGKAVIMETEIWPNLLTECASKGIPVFVINARLSAKSAKGYSKFSSLLHPALDAISYIAAQTKLDAERFVQIGLKPSKIKVFGNLKFEMDGSERIVLTGKEIRESLFNERFVWVIGSTHQPEERIFVDLYKKLKLEIPSLLLVVVPRHPERFTEVEKLCHQSGMKLVRRSSGTSCSEKTDVFLLDKMGELKQFYAAADLAFVGGSLAKVGGHNVLEPAALGIPVMFGPHMDNFLEIAKGILSADAAVQCLDPSEIEKAVIQFYQNPEFRNNMGQRGRQFIKQNQGCLERSLDLIASGFQLRKNS